MNFTRQLHLPDHHHPQQQPPLSHLSTDWNWDSIWKKCSGASPASLIQEMGNWTLGCMTHLKAAGKLEKTWGPGTLVPRLGDFQEGRDERNLNCIHCWVTLRCLQAPEWKFLSCCPSSLVQFYQHTCRRVGAGKQYSGLFLLGSRHSGRAPAVVTLGGSHAGGDWSFPTQIPIAPAPHSQKTDSWLTG